MKVDGDGKQESVKRSKKSEPDGIVSEGQGGPADEVPRTNRIDEDVKDVGGRAVEAQDALQVPLQNPQGTVACWERFLHLRSIKVLLVEDDDSTRHVVTALLRNCNYEVMEAANGLQAWKILEDLTNHIDLVLTEVVMPVLSGIGLLSKIMSHKTRKNIPVIMMSSHDSMGLVFKCLSKGAVDFLVKPTRKNELKNLWQHVWRRCHSSSSSGSESGTQTQKSVKSNSSEKSVNSGSNDGDDNGSIGLNVVGDGSDSGSGTQSSWTKQAGEVDSSQAVSVEDQIAECPDSTCAQVIRPNAKASGTKCLPVTGTRECQKPGENFDNVASGKELVIGRNSERDFCTEHPTEVPVKLLGRRQKDLFDFDSHMVSKQIEKGDLDPNSDSPLTKYKIDVTNISDPQTDSRECKAPKDQSKTLLFKDKAMDIELNLKRLGEVRGTGKTVQDDCNVLRHSEHSAFSRYNTASKAFKAPNENTGTSYPLDYSIEVMNKEQACSTEPPYRCSIGISSDNIHMGCTANKDFVNPVVFKDKSEAMSTANGFHMSPALKHLKTNLVSTTQQVILAKADDRAATKAVLSPRGHSHQELPIQHLHHCFNHFSKEQQQPPCNHDELSFNKLAADAPCCGSSNILSGLVEGNTGNCSLNKSASGSNHSSNGQNGSSMAANALGMNIENVNVVAGNSRSGDASGSGSGSGDNINQNKLAREAALTKFCQKRKERCFQKKVWYQSRKRLAEQRPRVRGQFVRKSDPENSCSAADS
ncbi:two-component response regulator-like APRR3 [Diospyros lotus]|uniref:two-component response regulator-like APRR3 n=1 Tax=Diospyros lotus TaxID=55363 RepID=UPI0022505990|nr:two-component response regulator-like APRR3 [Diospyros lotus]XP_052174958.1 two-component response regulator-like APRR3 [Diospyros lotus]